MLVDRLTRIKVSRLRWESADGPTHFDQESKRRHIETREVGVRVWRSAHSNLAAHTKPRFLLAQITREREVDRGEIYVCVSLFCTQEWLES